MKQGMLESFHEKLSIREQCRIIAMPRSRYYYKPQPIMLDMNIAGEIDRIYTSRLYYGTRRIRAEMRRIGYVIGRSRIRRPPHWGQCKR
ncbi:MAG: hypothetical protein KKB32_02430 [Acidobacteria bacterium]|nr:hypothetical protein [Acidobacteriota bacterium]